MTVKSHSPYKALFSPGAYFSRLVQAYPENGKIFGWLMLCALLPVMGMLVGYMRFYQAMGTEHSWVLYAGIFLSGFISEVMWWLLMMVVGYLILGPQARVSEISVVSLTPFLLWGVVLLVGGFLLPFPSDLAETKAILERELQYFNNSDIARHLFKQIQSSVPFQVMFYTGIAAFAYQAYLLFLGFKHTGIGWLRVGLAVLVLTFSHVVFQYNLNATWRFLDHGIVTEKIDEAPTEF